MTTKYVRLDGMPRGVLPGIINGELRAAAFDAEGMEVEVRWDMNKISAKQALWLSRDFAAFAEERAISERGR